MGFSPGEYTPHNRTYPTLPQTAGQGFWFYYGMKGLAATFVLFLMIAGHEPPVYLHEKASSKDTVVALVPQAVVVPVPDTIITRLKKEEPAIQTGNVSPYAVVQYAKTLIGTRYLYGSTDPRKGFDCSGFITYVFNHFNVKVPRSSVEFTDVGEEINYHASKPGDLILFTGTDSTIRVVGHMGIVVSNENNKLSFIHSTSGKQYGVTITELSPYYMSRFVRIARIFPENDATAAKVDKTLPALNETKSKIRGTKKTSSLGSSKTIDTAKTAKPNKSTRKNNESTVKKSSSSTKKTSVTKKSSTKKTSSTKPSSTTKKSSVTKKSATKSSSAVKKPVATNKTASVSKKTTPKPNTNTKKSTKKTTQPGKTASDSTTSIKKA
jgi:hypothetical protein